MLSRSSLWFRPCTILNSTRLLLSSRWRVLRLFATLVAAMTTASSATTAAPGTTSATAPVAAAAPETASTASAASASVGGDWSVTITVGVMGLGITAVVALDRCGLIVVTVVVAVSVVVTVSVVAAATVVVSVLATSTVVATAVLVEASSAPPATAASSGRLGLDVLRVFRVLFLFVVYLGFALTVIRASVAVGSAASTLNLIASLVRRVLATLNLGSFGAGDIGSFSHAFLALNDVEQDFLAVANGAKVLVPVVLCDRRLVDEHVFFGIVTIDEAIAVSNVEPLDLAAHALDDDSLLRCSRRVTASVVVIVSFDVYVGHWFGLDSGLDRLVLGRRSVSTSHIGSRYFHRCRRSKSN